MRKLIAAAVVTAVACIPFAQAAPIEGCQAINPVVSSCTYQSEESGGFIALGAWKVTVHWSGVCTDEVTHGDNGWIRSSAGGDNNIVEGVLGASNGTVYQGGYCVEAEALEPGSVVVVGHVGPFGQDDPPPPPV